VVTHQLQVERRTAKERWPETDVLPLTHADQLTVTVYNEGWQLYNRDMYQYKDDINVISELLAEAR